MSADVPTEGVASVPLRQPQPAAPRPSLPWEIPNPAKPDGWMPYWETSQDTIGWLEKEGRAALREIPTQIYNRGERLKAREMRDWIDSSPIFINELAEELAGRIVCTRRAEQKSRQQKDQLSILALRGFVDYLRKHKPNEATHFDQYYQLHSSMYEWLAREFVDAIADCYFSDR